MPGSQSNRIKRLEQRAQSPNEREQTSFGQDPEEIRAQFFKGIEETAERAALLVESYRRGEPLSDPYGRDANNAEKRAHALALAWLERDDEARELLGLERPSLTTRNERALQAVSRAMDTLVVDKFMKLMEEKEKHDG